MENEEGGVHAEPADVQCDHVQLFLEWCLLFWLGLDSCQNLSLCCQVADNYAEEPAFACLDLSAREEHGGWNDVRTALAVLLVFGRFMLHFSSQAFLNRFFGQVIGLAGQGRLISQHTRALQNNSINWNVHAANNFDHIANQ